MNRYVEYAYSAYIYWEGTLAESANLIMLPALERGHTEEDRAERVWLEASLMPPLSEDERERLEMPMPQEVIDEVFSKWRAGLMSEEEAVDRLSGHPEEYFARQVQIGPELLREERLRYLRRAVQDGMELRARTYVTRPDDPRADPRERRVLSLWHLATGESRGRRGWNRLSCCLSGDCLLPERIGAVNALISELLVQCAELCNVKYGWFHLSDTEQDFQSFGMCILHGGLGDYLFDLTERWHSAQAAGRKSDWIPDVFWGNYWGKGFVEKLGGTQSLVSFLESICPVKVVADGSVLFYVLADVLSLREPRGLREFELARARIRAFLQEKGVLLPSMKEIDPDYDASR